MSRKTWAKVCACVVVAAFCVSHGSAHATADVQVRVDACSGDFYPRIVCDVSVRDMNGRTVDHLEARAFGVEFDEQTVMLPKVTQAEAPVERSELILVLDDGVANHGRYARHWRRAANAILQNLPSGHGALVLNASQAYESAIPLLYSTADEIERMRAQVRTQKLTMQARLYDALCDAAAQAPRSARPSVWLAVVSDGLDRGSTVCDLDEAVRAIERAHVPVLVIGIGPYAGELRRAAAASNGLFADAEDAEGVAAAMREVMQRSRRRYRVEFAVPNPADGRAHSVTVSVHGDARGSAFVDALPLAPTLLGLNLSSEGLAVAETNLPSRGRVRVEPRFAGKGASVAEFVLDGMRTRVDAPPYAFEFDGGRLPHDRPTVLSVTMYGASGEANAASTTEIRIAPEGSAAAFQIDPKGAGVRAWVAGSAGSLAAGSASALLLSAVCAVLLRRWQRGPVLLRAAQESPLQNSAHRSAMDAPTITPRFERTGQMSEAGQLHLLIRSPGADVQQIRLRDAGVLGRGAPDVHNEIVVQSRFVSIRHARFAPAADGWQVEDLHSANGVRHNGRILNPGAASPLRAGDRIACADVMLEVASTT